MKKILAIALVLAMTMALSLSVCAASPIEAENGTDSVEIKIKNTISSTNAPVYYVVVEREITETFAVTTSSTGEWLPEQHKYEDGLTTDISGAGKVTVTNHSNTDVTATLTFTGADAGYIDFDKSSDFITLADASTHAYGNFNGADSDEITFEATDWTGEDTDQAEVIFTAVLTIS